MKARKLAKKTAAKYERIIDEWFVNGFNGAEAYRKFYKTIKSNETAAANFSRLQSLPQMEGYIHRKHEDAAKVIETTHEGILKELKQWIESDITETICLSPEEIKQLPISLKRLITKYTVRENVHYDKDGALLKETKTIELHFVSKERAFEMINKHVGFYEADNKQKAAVINYDSLSEQILLSIWDARKKD